MLVIKVVDLLNVNNLPYVKSYYSVTNVWITKLKSALYINTKPALLSKSKSWSPKLSFQSFRRLKVPNTLSPSNFSSSVVSLILNLLLPTRPVWGYAN